jgi:hypothetical protein
MVSLSDVVSTELRRVLELALQTRGGDGRDLVSAIDSKNRRTYVNGQPARLFHQWQQAFVEADAELQMHWFQKNQPLQLTGSYIAAKISPGTSREAPQLTTIWQELLSEVMRQESQDLVLFFKVYYERNYTHGGGELPPVLREKAVIRNNALPSETDTYMKQVWSGIRSRNEALTIEYVNHIVHLWTVQYSECSERGLGVLLDSVAAAFKVLGFDVEGTRTGGLNVKAIGKASAYLDHHAGTTVAPSVTARPPNVERGREYFYAWWLFDSEQDFMKISKSMRWPRNRQENRVNYREPGRTEETLAELLAASKGTGDVTGSFLGARDLVNRNVPFTDEVTPLPALRAGQVIALGAARAKFFDLATKELRIGSWFHGVQRQPGMTMLEYIRAWIREGKIRFDVTNLIWHWNRWNGPLPATAATPTPQQRKGRYEKVLKALAALEKIEKKIGTHTLIWESRDELNVLKEFFEEIVALASDPAYPALVADLKSSNSDAWRGLWVLCWLMYDHADALFKKNPNNILVPIRRALNTTDTSVFSRAVDLREWMKQATSEELVAHIEKFVGALSTLQSASH